MVKQSYHKVVNKCWIAECELPRERENNHKGEIL